MGPKIHLLWDLTTHKDAAVSDLHAGNIGLLASTEKGLGNCVEQATILVHKPLAASAPLLPLNWELRVSQQTITEANQTLELAGDFGAHLLVLLGTPLISAEAVGALAESFKWDPHFGVATPRFCEPVNGEPFKLRSELGDPEFHTYPRRVLAEVPECYILPEVLSPCFLIRREVVATLSALDTSYQTLAGALLQYLSSIRRAGFRTAVVNQAVSLWTESSEALSVIVSQHDNRKLLLAFPDVGRAQVESAEHSLHLHETLLAHLYSSKIKRRKSMLLDLRGIPAHMNGTVEAVMAICDALHKVHTDWDITLLAVAAAADYHNLRARYSCWTVLTREGLHFFTVALRLSQPWKFETLVELHEMALLNFYVMLDTIAWDILFEAPASLGAAWTFLADYADGLLYNSDYTRKHFIRRFRQADGRTDYVLHHSFDPRDYTNGDLTRTATEPSDEYLFVVGNNYDHKNLRATVDLLSSAFPFRKLIALGLLSHPGDNVECLPSGSLAANKIDELFAGARLIVFPSLYEGFGFPVLKGLSYGRNVVARHSELLSEVAAQYRGPGELFGYSTSAELVGLTGKILHNVPVESIPLGSALGQTRQPKSWDSIAIDLISFIEAQMANSERLWLKRERAIRQLEAYRE